MDLNIFETDKLKSFSLMSFSFRFVMNENFTDASTEKKKKGGGEGLRKVKF